MYAIRDDVATIMVVVVDGRRRAAVAQDFVEGKTAMQLRWFKARERKGKKGDSVG